MTDHKPLTWVYKVKDPSSCLLRWRMKLDEYDYQDVYKPGMRNTNADALSRIPMTSISPVAKIIERLRKRKEVSFAGIS